MKWEEICNIGENELDGFPRVIDRERSRWQDIDKEVLFAVFPAGGKNKSFLLDADDGGSAVFALTFTK